MSSSGLIRDMRELHPAFVPLAAEWLRLCASKLYPLLVVETRRTIEVAEAYYARGRKPLAVVNDLYETAGLPPITEEANRLTITSAVPGLSWHMYGLAIDAVPFAGGKPDWTYDPQSPADLYDEVAGLAVSLGMEWGGRWRSRKDCPHVEWHPGWEPNEAMNWSAMHGGDWRIPIPRP